MFKYKLINNRHLTTIGSLVVTAFLLFTFDLSFGQKDNKPKSLSALYLDNDATIVFEVYPIENPYVRDILHVDWSKISTGSTFGGVSGGLFGAVSGGLTAAEKSIDDQTPEVKNAVMATLKNIDLQQLFLDALERNLKPKTKSQTLYLTNSTRKETSLGQSDRLVKMNLFFNFQGGHPSIKARLIVSLVAKNTNISELDQELDSFWKLTEEMRSNSPTGAMKETKNLMELIRASKRIMSYNECAQVFKVKSHSHSVEDWLKNDGSLIRQELEIIMDQLAIELADIVFKDN